MNSEEHKLQLIKVEIKEEKQLIPIDFKLAQNLKHCKGIFFSVKEYLDIQSDTIPQVGELSLLFNAKAIHPLHFTVEYTKNLLHKKEFLALDCDLEPNSNITGYYLDYGKTKAIENQFLPYTLTIYLACSYHKPEITK